MSWIQTQSGRRFDVLHPDPALIDIEDIAHALSNLCRFTGHTREFYSVAQHSSLLVGAFQNNLGLMRAALLHDASEAYLCDVAKPVKELPAMAPYRALEAEIQRAVGVRFGVSQADFDAVKEADFRMLVTEARQLMTPTHPDWAPTLSAAEPFDIHICCWTPAAAMSAFLAFYRVLF